MENIEKLLEEYNSQTGIGVAYIGTDDDGCCDCCVCENEDADCCCCPCCDCNENMECCCCPCEDDADCCCCPVNDDTGCGTFCFFI